MCTQKPLRLSAHNVITFKPLGHMPFVKVRLLLSGQIRCSPSRLKNKLHLWPLLYVMGLETTRVLERWTFKKVSPIRLALSAFSFLFIKIHISALFKFPHADPKYTVSALASGSRLRVRCSCWAVPLKLSQREQRLGIWTHDLLS